MKRKLIYLVILILMFVFVFCFSVTCTRLDSKSVSEENSLNNEVITEKIYYDIPSLVGKDGWQIKEILEKSHGKPDVYVEPTKDLFGTLSWIATIENTKNTLIFGFDFYKDGKIADNTLILTGIIEKGEPIFLIEDVLRAGNLREDDPSYRIEINMDDETYKNVWVIMN